MIFRTVKFIIREGLNNFSPARMAGIRIYNLRGFGVIFTKKNMTNSDRYVASLLAAIRQTLSSDCN